MNSKTRFLIGAAVVVAAAGALSIPVLQRANAAGKPAGATAWLKGVQQGNPGLKSIGALGFGPAGLLLVAEPAAASIVAIDTGDTGPVRRLQRRIDDVGGLIAGRLGAPADQVRIVDLTVNPASGKIYLSVVLQTGNRPALLSIDADGRVEDVPLEKVGYVRVPLPAGEGAKVRSISAVKFAGDRVLAAGSANEEFSSKIFSLPVPLAHGQAAKVFSAETYHVSHRKWETRAPIQSFIPHQENGRHYVLGAFACTPIAKFPLNDLSPGAQVRGISVVELGSGNRPIDMFTYERGGRQWLVTHTQRMGEREPFGPSKFWGARIDLNHIHANTPDRINENAVRRNVKTKAGPEGIEIVDSLFGAVQVDKLNNDEAVVLRENGDKLALELAKLP